MDILLINGNRTDYAVLPVGLGYIAQAIDNAGYDYDVRDVMIDLEADIVEYARMVNPRFIGIGTMSYKIQLNYALIKKLKKCLPDTIIILGGPHGIAAGVRIFDECEHVDIVVQGEGEKVILEILIGNTNSLPNILNKNDLCDSSIEYLDINKIDFPKYKKFRLNRYGSQMHLASSRGCVYKCSFCGAQKFLGRKWRAFSEERMFCEFEYWYKKGYRCFYFCDSLFLLDKKRVSLFCKKLLVNNYFDVKFVADGIRADNLDFDMLSLMKSVGFNAITIGVESVDDEVLKFYNKSEDYCTIDRAIKIADELGFNISIYIIIGAPLESYISALKSIYYAKKYKNIRTVIYTKLIPILGTPYYDFMLKNNMLKDLDSYYPNIEVASFNSRTLSGERSEILWRQVQPDIERMLVFLRHRAYIVNALNYFNINLSDVKIINFITDLTNNKVVAMIHRVFKIYIEIQKH